MTETDRLFSTTDERAILGKILMDPTEWAVDHADSDLQPEHFAIPAHAIIWRSVLALQVEARDCDAASVIHHLRTNDELVNIPGGVDAILDIATVAGTGFLQPSIERVVDYWKRRQLRDGLMGVIRECPNGVNADSHLNATQKLLDDIQRNESTQSPLAMAFTLAMNELEAREAACLAGKESTTYLTTGYYDLDALCQLHAGEVTVLAARPSIGKTALALNIASRVAKKGKGVLFFSLETDEKTLGHNLIAAECSVDTHAMRTGDGLGVAEYQRMQKEVACLTDLRLLFVCQPSITPMSMRLRARNAQRRFGVDLIVIDYLQLLDSGSSHKRESRQLEVSSMSRAIKQMASELKVPVIVLSQLNREIEKRDAGRPRLSDLRESGAIEQDADVVILLHRDRDAATIEEKGITEVHVAKNRGGKTGKTTLRFALPYCRFENYTRSTEPI
jgi:replicative DNA helicase